MNNRLNRVVALAAVVCGVASASSAFALEIPSTGMWNKLPQIGRLQQAWAELGSQSQVYRFLTGKKADFQIAGESVSPEMSTLRFQHYFRGVKVLGSQSLQHQKLNVISRTDWTHQLAQFDLNTVPSVGASAAMGIARTVTGGREVAGEPALLILPSWKAGAAKLIYRFVIEAQGEEAGRIVDIDAHSGEVLADISRHWTIAPVDVYATNKKCQVLESDADDLGGKAPISVDFKKCKLVIKAGVPSASADVEALAAADNSNKVLHYYWDTHSRDSFDGLGAKVNAIVHIGHKWVNAFWDSQNEIMAYGDGDGKIFKPLTQSVDVAGHEMTHGVVSKTADLEYQSESGALNEGFADYFGESIEGHDDWVMGANLFFDAAQGVNGIRNLKDPHQTTYRSRDKDGNIVARPAPAKYDEIFKFDGEYCGGQNDNCGVHMNATLVGHVGFNMVNAIGREKSDKLFYTTLVHYLTNTSNFAAFGQGARKACGTLYDAATCSSVESVLVQAGL
jgi:Zn-dependent metalloprotease